MAPDLGELGNWKTEPHRTRKTDLGELGFGEQGFRKPDLGEPSHGKLDLVATDELGLVEQEPGKLDPGELALVQPGLEEPDFQIAGRGCTLHTELGTMSSSPAALHLSGSHRCHFPFPKSLLPPFSSPLSWPHSVPMYTRIR